MNDQARQVLCGIVRKYGRGVCDEPRRVRALLADLCPDLKRECHALAEAQEHGAAADLTQPTAGVPVELTLGRLARRLADETAMSEEAARWAVASWAAALGMIPAGARVGPSGHNNSRTAPMGGTVPTAAPPPRPRDTTTWPPRRQPDVLPPPNKPNVRHKGSAYLWISGVVFIALLAAGYFLWPWNQAIDPELQTDWDDAGRVIMTTGSSVAFYKERGPKRVQAWKRAAEGDNPKGMYMFARCLQEGAGVSQDKLEAHKWLRKAADLGNARAMNALGVDYDEGTVVTKDEKEALRWYQKAADQGDLVGQNNLGLSYENGQGVTQSYAEAVKWYRKAAEQGSVLSQNNLGLMYENGHGVTQNDAEAVKWYRMAADQGGADGETNLAHMYENGKGVPSGWSDADRYKEAVKWARKAADQGDAQGEADLGYMYMTGEGVPVEMSEADRYQEALKWLRLATDQNNAFAEDSLGIMYVKGNGVAKNFPEAVRLFRLAAEGGDVTAMQNLARLLETGAEGVPANPAEAEKWKEKAAEQPKPGS